MSRETGDPRSEITRILGEAASGTEAVERVLPLLYEELRVLASRFLAAERAGHTLQPTEVVHEAYLRLVDDETLSFAGRRHFLATAAVAMRHLLIDHARKKGAGKRIPTERLVTIAEPSAHPGADPVDVLALDRALDRLAELDPRQTRIVELRYFGGLTVPETAGVLELSEATVAREWRAAKLWLKRELKRSG